MGALRARLERNRGASDDGAVLVEFVLIFPVLLILILGIVEVSRLGLAYHEAWTAAREGARAASTVGAPSALRSCLEVEEAIGERITVTDVQYAVEFYLPGATDPFADCSDASTTVPEPDASSYATNPEPGTNVIVTVESPFEGLLIPFAGRVFAGIPLDAAQLRTIESGRSFNEDGIIAPPTTAAP